MKGIRYNIQYHLKGLIAKKKKNDDLVDTNIKMETNTVVEGTTEIIDSQLNNEGL